MTDNFDSGHLIGVALSLALGLLAGVQRGWTLRNQEQGSRFAGIRTFALIGLAGGLAGVLHAHSRGPATAIIVAAAALIVAGYYRTSVKFGTVSGTSGIVGLLVLACGFLSGSGEHLLGSAIAVVMVLLLAMREQLHGWVGRLTEDEVVSIARFALIAVVILPILPDAGYGPYGAWNPRQLWLVVVLVSGFSFAGYFGAKLLGPTRGIIATAAAGSMVSSTAVTASLAHRMRDGQGDQAILAAGVSVASVVMFLRVLMLTGFLAPFALVPFARLVGPAIVGSLLPAIWYLRRARTTPDAPADQVRLRNPFDLWPAVMLTALVMALTVTARWVLDQYGDRGLAVVLAISGSVDVDSAIITMGELPAGSLTPRMAGLILAAPVTLNSLFKASVAVSVGGWKKGGQAAWPLVASATLVVLACILIG